MTIQFKDYNEMLQFAEDFFQLITIVNTYRNNEVFGSRCSLKNATPHSAELYDVLNTSLNIPKFYNNKFEPIIIEL